jgi:hypothetical protein
MANLRANISVEIRLECFSIIEELTGGTISQVDTQELVEATAARIRSLYSQTRRENIYESRTDWVPGHAQEGLVLATWSEVVGSYTVPDPDVEGIRQLVTMIPETLRLEVCALSAEASVLF